MISDDPTKAQERRHVQALRDLVHIQGSAFLAHHSENGLLDPHGSFNQLTWDHYNDLMMCVLLVGLLHVHGGHGSLCPSQLLDKELGGFSQGQQSVRFCT